MRFCLWAHYKNIDTGESTSLDPRLRGFKGADECSAALTRLDYIERYNTKPADCGSYWGHEGRKVSVGLRLFVRIFIFPGLFLAIALDVTSFVAVFCANETLNHDEMPVIILGTIGTITPFFYAIIAVLLSLPVVFAALKPKWFRKNSNTDERLDES
jgi:hypothetical protein